MTTTIKILKTPGNLDQTPKLPLTKMIMKNKT